MESVDSDVLRESAIFAALSPRGYSRQDRSQGTSDVRGSMAADSTLPPVNPRNTSSILWQSATSQSFSPKTPQSLIMAIPMTTNECWIVWKFLCDWVKTQLAMEVPASIPGFGTFYLCIQALGIRITFFEPDKQFLNKFCIQVDSEMPDPARMATLPSTVSNTDALMATGGRGRAASVFGLGDVFAFSFVEMAACCGNAVDSTRAQEWLNTVIHKLGNAMSQCGRVELNIGAGVIVCIDRVIQRHLLSRDSRPSPRPEYEIRTGESVVKRKLRAQAALQATPTPSTKHSFLSGSTFSSLIQLNPVLDHSDKDVPDFSFGPNPRRPKCTSVVVTSHTKASPRSTQLHKRYQRSSSPVVTRTNTSVTAEQAPCNEGNEVNTLLSLLKQDEAENRIPPQLFDPLSRTLCVEPDQNVSYLLPSNRIGSNFTESAALLMTEKSASQFGLLTQHAGDLVLVEKSSLAGPSLERQRKVPAHSSIPDERYFEYLSHDKFIDRSYLSPLPAELEARVVAAAVKYIMGPSSDQIENVMEMAHKEFVDNYYASAKKAILNYLLMRVESCTRLGMPQGVPVHALLPIKWKWGSSDGPTSCSADLKALVMRRRNRPPSTKRIRITDGISHSNAVYSKAVRRKRVQSKLISLLVLSNPQVRALRYMWHDMHASITLVDLPSIESLSHAVEPMDILEFERAQLAYSAKIKVFVMENWYTKTKMMFESAVRAETFSIHTSEAAVNSRLRHLFDTIAAVMSLQLRSLIIKSIQAYVDFFELFGAISEINQETDDNLQVKPKPTYSGLLTTLVLREGQIQFRDPLVDIPSRLLNVLHNIPKLFTNLPRIETQFDDPILLPHTSSPFLWNVASQEDDIVVATIRIRAIIEQNLTHLRKLQTDYDMFALTHRYVNSVDCFHLEENSELETYRAEMERVQATAMRLAIDNRHSQQLGLFSVDCRQVNTRLHTDLAQWTIRLLEAFEQRTGRLNAELRQQYKEIAARLAKKPLDLYELVDAETFVQFIKSAKLQELQDKGNVIKQRLRFLLFERENMHIGNVAVNCSLNAPINDSEHDNEGSLAASFRLSVDLLASTAKTVKWRSHMEKLLKEAESLLVTERARIEAMFIAKRSRFQAEIEEFEGEVRGFAKKGDLRHAATYVVQLAKMHDNLFIFRQAMATIIQEEQKLQWKSTDFGQLDDIAQEMAPYEQLWKTVREFREMNSRWLRGNVFELPGEEGMQTLQQMLTIVANVSNVLLLSSAAAAITAETVRKQMTDFRENVRLIVALQNPAMKERHMNAVSGLIGIDFTTEEVITLLKLLENGAFELVSKLVDISDNATQEQHIERALNEIWEEWQATSVELVPSRHPLTSCSVLATLMTSGGSKAEAFNVVLEKTCAGRIVSLTEDHLVRLQSLSCMSHAGPFIKEIALWQVFANEMGQVVEILTVIEQLWRKITPFFAADIVESDSDASQLFARAAKLYHAVHSAILCTPACTGFFQRTSLTMDQSCLSPVRTLISDLKQCHEMLETVRGHVRDGLEIKRSSFARFYFLSDAELVTAFALTRTPNDTMLWKALSRCFPGIHSVQTNAANEITALLSSAGESFPLGSPIVTVDTPMPTWLTKLETSMTTILHASIRAAYNDLPRKEFRKWCLIWPEQSLVAALQHGWTLESEQAYRSSNQRKAWTEITDKIFQNIDAVSKEMRVATYPHVKATLANIILMLTQLRDVSTAILTEVGGPWMENESLNTTCPHALPSFVWIAQPRFYFVDNVLSITMMTCSYLPYGLEYLGNGATGILVTPLTLRCYHAIAQAASTMRKGACLEGPAGAGKSTICRQLAHLCGRLYVTFQCANKKVVIDELVHFTKATASSGSWLCIDNSQLLNTRQMSIITLLCAQVMTELAARHAHCTLVGDRVRLRRGAFFLLTVTTRHQLTTPVTSVQDSHFFFRTILVQSPDIDKLAEFELSCSRFVHASALAKLVAIALCAFERGFELLNPPSETTNGQKILKSRFGNLRLLKNVVKRATELNNSEKERRRRTRQSSLLSPEVDEGRKEVQATEETTLNDATAEAIARRDEERMEHRNVVQAIRECVGSIVPSANLHLINSVLRDFNPQSLARDFRGSSVLIRSRVGEDVPKRSLEDEVENYVRTQETAWKCWGVEFGLKTVQLLQTMRTHRAVVLSGENHTGKTSLYASLSRALTQISKKKASDQTNTQKRNTGDADGELTLVAPIRCVVVCPRALQLGQLLDLEAEEHSRSVFYKLVHEAKTLYKIDKCTQTWLVFDGDLDALWSEQLMYTIQELQDDIPGYRKGVRLSSGKFLLVPDYVRVIMETTTLTNASPSFVTRVGAVHVNGYLRNIDSKGWENVYKVWKLVRKTEFKGYAELIFAILDTVVSETVPAALEFVDANFQNSIQAVMRIQWTLAMFYSSLKQFWEKFGALTSDKQRTTAVQCLFLQALVWGVGSTTNALERRQFHVFLYDLILHGSNHEQSPLKRMIMLFFPNGLLVGSLSSNIGGDKSNTSSGMTSNAGLASRKRTLYDYGFSLAFGSKWLLWTDYYLRWSQMLLGTASSGSINSGFTAEANYPLSSQLNHLVVPTGATASAICLSGQLLLASYPAILTGPKDCGKTVCGSAWLLLSAAVAQIPTRVEMESTGSGSSEDESEIGNAKKATDESTSNTVLPSVEKIYAGFYTGASHVLRQFEPALQRIRHERQRDSITSRATRARNDSNASLETLTSTVIPDSKHTVYIFLDDLHCFDPNRKMDSSLEMFRMLAEYQTVVDPVTSLVTPCNKFLPFATLELSSQHRRTQSDDLRRLVGRFIPVALQEFSDSDLITICESFSLSSLNPLSQLSTGGASSGALFKEYDQLHSMVVKASLKLYRLLTSPNDFAILSKESAFNPIKLHYNFRVAHVFQVVQTICCELLQPALSLPEKSALARLWCHETARVFGDNITDPNESSAFHRRTIEIALATFGVADVAFFPVYFEPPALQNPTITQQWLATELHFSFFGDSTTNGGYRNGYHEVEMSKLQLVVERSLMTMNNSDSDNPESMEIIICSFVIKHVLRISRQLRLGRKAVLLLGAAGTKLATITRLACLMCKKVPIMSQIPKISNEFDKEHVRDRRKWNTTLRAAMLKCVRARDAPVVILVKDIYLHPEAFPYRLIDQFLGGHNLPAEVVAFEDLDDEILAILRENLQADTVPRAPTPSVFGSEQAILDHFFHYARQKLQLVLILAPSSNEIGTQSKNWTSILWRYPNIWKYCDINYAGSWATNDLVTIAQKCLTQASVTVDTSSTMQLSEAAVRMYETTCRFLDDRRPQGLKTDETGENDDKNDSRKEDVIPTISWDNYLSSLVRVEPSMLIDHLGLFTSHYEQLQRSVASNVARFKAGLEFMDQTAQILRTEQTQAELLLPEVREKTELRRRMSGSLERENIVAEKVTRGLELATSLVITQRERLATVTQEYYDLIQESRALFHEMRHTLRIFHEAFQDEDEDDNKKDKTEDENDANGDREADKVYNADKIADNTKHKLDSVEGLEAVARRRRRNQVYQFASLDRIPSSIYQLSECLGVILGIAPVEGHDEMDPDEVIMDYWTNVAIQVKTAAFWQTLTTFDVPKHATETMLTALLPICRSPDFDQELFASVHEVAGVLCDWVQKCAAFARDFVLAGPKHAQVERERTLLKQAEAQVVKSKMEIFDQNASAQNASTLRDVSELERQRVDARMQDTTSVLQVTNAAWKVLVSTRAKWKLRYEAYRIFAEHWEADLLLATAVVAYASCLNDRARVELYGLWTQAVALHSLIPSSLRRSLHEVFRIRDVDLIKMTQLNGLASNDESTLDNGVIALNCYRLPLLVDPYGIATDWLKKQLGTGRLCVASANKTTTNAGVWKVVETSIKQETTLILMDICKDRLQGLHSFLGAKRRGIFNAINHDMSIRNRTSSGYHCWCYPPDDIEDKKDLEGASHTLATAKVGSSHTEARVFEFGSDVCKVFFVCTTSTPEWMTEYLSQLTVIPFELTAPFVETQALQKLLESQGRLREVTAIRTLQQEVVVCDEQLYGLEDELLDFFSTEQAGVVYSENSKALRIVANRSAVNTLQSAKAQALTKIQTHWESIVSYVAVARRCVDSVWAWREFKFLTQEENSFSKEKITLKWVWQLLVRAGARSNTSDNHLEEVMARFTSSLQYCVLMNLRDENRLLFRFLLAFRIWQRRMGESLDATEMPLKNSSSSHVSTGIDCFVRLLSLVSSQSDRNVCRPTLKSLLALRPTSMKATVWSAICYLAEVSEALRQFISRMESLANGPSVWKAVLDLGIKSSREWNVPVPLDAFMRLCLVVAIHPTRFLWELEDFARHELQRLHSVPRFTSTLSSVTVTGTTTLSLPTVVAAAAHTAQSEASDRHSVLFYMWQSFSSAKTPLIVFCPTTIDFVDAVANVSRRAGAAIKTTDTIQLLLADEASFKQMMLSAMEKGLWVVLPNLHSCPDRFEQLNSIYELLNDEQTHSDFRLWISLRNESVHGLVSPLGELEPTWVHSSTIHRQWGTGFLSLKRGLHHTFTIIKAELDGFTFASSRASPTATQIETALLSHDDEKCMKQLGVFHALVSCRDQLPFAQWKTSREFGDTELCAAVRSMVSLKTEEATHVNERESPLSVPRIGMWNRVTLGGVITNIYASTLKSKQDQLLIQCCLEFVYNAWPTMQDEVKLDTPTRVVALTTVPEVVFAIEKLAVIPWVTVVNEIPLFWISESCGPPLARDSLAVGGSNFEGVMLWDPYNLHRDRQKQIITQLAKMAARRACHVNSNLLPTKLPCRKMLPLLELLASFRKKIDDVMLPASGDSDYEYRKPISALINHEQQALEEIRSVIRRDIKRLESVSFRARSLDPATWQVFEDLRDDRVPTRWLALLRLPSSNIDSREGWNLYKFQDLLLGRLNAFSSWKEPGDGPHKLPLDKFLETEYVLEAVHQHFARKHVGNALCCADCLKIVSLYEDSPRLTLPAKEDVVYFTGLRAMGHLQLQVINSRGHFRRASITPEGVPVILQVSSSCLSEMLGTSSRKPVRILSEMRSEDEKSKTTKPSQSIEFLCPLFRVSAARDRAMKTETSIRVVTTLPIEQFVLSGASLHLQTGER